MQRLKTDIHCHLEACFRHRTLVDIGKRVHVEVPEDEAEFTERFLAAEPKESLEAILAGFDLVRNLWIDPPAIKRLTQEAVEDAYDQGIRLLELRYSPDFIQSDRNLSFEVIHESILEGIDAAHRDIAVGLIGIVRRTLPQSEAKALVDFFIANKDTFVGIDLADRELGYPGKDFANLFLKAKDSGLGITVHAGEVNTDESRQNVKDAIELMGATRIGHGLHISSDPALIELVIERGITLELCPTSNVLTGSVPDLASHPFKQLMQAGVKTTINGDDPNLFAINFEHEYLMAESELGLTESQIELCISNAKQASFIAPEEIIRCWKQ